MCGLHRRAACAWDGPAGVAAVPANGDAHGAPAEDLHGLAGSAGGDVVGLVAQAPPQDRQRRESEDRRDGEQQPAVGDDGDRGIGGIHAVEDEGADQAAVDAADPARDRDQAAELADEVGDEQDAGRRHVVAERLEADAEHGDVEEQVGGGAEQDRRVA